MILKVTEVAPESGGSGFWVGFESAVALMSGQEIKESRRSFWGEM